MDSKVTNSTTTTIQQWSRTLQEAQKNAAEGAKQEFAKDYSRAFALYVRAGESYLWLARTYDEVKGRASTSAQATLLDALPSGDQSDVKGRIRNAADKVLRRAQLIKQLRPDVKPPARKIVGKEEQLRALKAVECLNDIPIPIWQGEPDASTFEGEISASPSQSSPTLSPSQVARDAQFKGRRDDVKWSKSLLCASNDLLGGQDILQDVVNDCSFVAALEVAAEHDRRRGTSLAHSGLYPQDKEGRPCWSKNGRHLVRLRLNGVDRYVCIDDRLPCDLVGRPLCAVGRPRSTSSLPADDLTQLRVWPALLEKAFLSLHGGYDFGGSNSAADVYTLTGWIPEDLGFHRAEFQREKSWQKLFAAFDAGNVMLTAGTGKNAASQRTSTGAKLIDLHNYAILSMTEDQNGRVITLMNPWRHLPDHVRCEADDLSESVARLDVAGRADAGLMSMSWDEACSRLDTLYLNWNPDLFRYSEILHALWTVHNETAASTSVASRPTHVQVLLDVERATQVEGEEVVIHLERHLNSKEQTQGKPWIALHAFSKSIDAEVQPIRCVSTYVDGTHILLRYKAITGLHSVVASLQRDDAASRDKNTQAFTVRAYSNAKIAFVENEEKFATVKTIAGRWSLKSAGGNALCPTFMHNPQYLVRSTSSTRSAASSVRWTVETDRDVAVQIVVVWGRSVVQGVNSGEAASSDYRVDSISPGQVVCSSGDYSYGLAIAEMTDFRSNTPYVAIVSTYMPGTEVDYTLRLQTTADKLDVRTIAAEGAGMHQQRVRGSWSVRDGTARGAPRFGNYRQNPTYRLILDKAGALIVRLVIPGIASKSTTIASENKQSSSQHHINVSLLSASSGAEVASSGAYDNRISGVSLKCEKMEPGEYLIVVSTFERDAEASYVMSIHSERQVTVTRTFEAR